MRWHHVTCTDTKEDAKYSKGAWTCPVCRDMSNRLHVLEDKLDQVMAILLTKLATPNVSAVSTTIGAVSDENTSTPSSVDEKNSFDPKLI